MVTGEVRITFLFYLATETVAFLSPFILSIAVEKIILSKGVEFMNRSISVVEYKVQQTEFFLRRLDESGLNFFAVQCYADAFANCARTITLSLQAVVGKVEGFEEWYGIEQDRLRNNSLARFFVNFRNVSSKIGDTCVRGGSFKKGPDGNIHSKYYFGPIPDIREVPQITVFDACAQYFETLLRLVYDSMVKFKCELDGRWYFTQENFSKHGKTIEDALVEVGLPKDWLVSPDLGSQEEQWRVFRQTQAIGCQINVEFQKYLGCTIDGPDEQIPEMAKQ